MECGLSLNKMGLKESECLRFCFGFTAEMSNPLLKKMYRSKCCATDCNHPNLHNM